MSAHPTMRILAVFVAVVVTLAPTRARAGDGVSESTARINLISEGQQLAAKGQHAAALERFGRAAALAEGATPGLRMLIANSQWSLGQLAEALDSAERCVSDAQANAQLANRDAILSFCGKLAARARPMVGWLTITAPQAPDGLKVEVQGRACPTQMFGLPFPVTPGTLHVHATAPGHVDTDIDVTLAAGASAPVELALPAAPAPPPCASGEARDAAGTCVAGALPAAPALRASAPPVPDASLVAPSGPPRSRVVPAVLVGVGGVGLAVGVVAWFMAGAAVDSYQSCDQLCDQPEIDRRAARVHVRDDVAGIAAVSGVALLGAGLGLFYFSGRSASKRDDGAGAASGGHLVVPSLGRAGVGWELVF